MSTMKVKLENHVDLDELKEALVKWHSKRYGYREQDMDLLVKHLANSTFEDILEPLTAHWLETGHYMHLEGFVEEVQKGKVIRLNQGKQE